MPASGSSPRLSRQTIIIAADLLKSLGHTGFDRLLLEYGISDLEAGRALGGLLNRANALANYAIINPTIKTAEGEPIAEAIVNRARQILDNVTPEEGIKFNAALARDGFANPVGGTMTYRITKPANLTPEQKRRAIPLLQLGSMVCGVLTQPLSERSTILGSRF